MYIIPEPKHMELKNGYCALNVFSRIRISDGCPLEVWEHARLLGDEFRAVCAADLDICYDTGRYGTADILYELCGGMPEEQYSIVIDSGLARLRAGSVSGFLYATQTVRQMIRQCGMEFPQIVIDDMPDIKIRGYYHDVTRGRVPTLDYLKHLADTCSFYKINQLQLYVEHSFLFSELDGMFSDGDPLTADEIRAFDCYCKKLNIELVPSLSTFGHLYELLRSGEYSELCEMEHTEAEFSMMDRMEHYTIDVSNEGSIELIGRMIREYAALFSSDKFNICADETFDLGKGKNRLRAEREGTTDLYLNYLKKLCGIVVDLGKTPMFWGDILQDHPEKINELPEEAVCLYWNYDADIREERIEGLVRNGVRNICLCPGVQGWQHLINHYRDAYVNITRMSQAAKYQIGAFLNTDWGDYGHVNHPDFSVPGLIYGAAFSWRTRLLSFEEINRQISVVEFGDRDGSFMQIITALSEGEDVKWSELVAYKERKTEIRQSGAASAKKNAALQKALDQGYARLTFLPRESRRRMYAWLLAAEGQKLWNCQRQRRSCENWDYKHSLLKWYALYQRLWRSVSKESELERIGEIVRWYAR